MSTIKTYLNLTNGILDIGVDDKSISLISFMIYNSVFKRYWNFDCLYDVEYSIAMIETCIYENLPKLFILMRKNALAVSKIFNKISNYGNNTESQNENTQSYQGLNTMGDFSKTTSKYGAKNQNYINILLTMDVEFEHVFNIMRQDIQKLVKTIYVL